MTGLATLQGKTVLGPLAVTLILLQSTEGYFLSLHLLSHGEGRGLEVGAELQRREEEQRVNHGAGLRDLVPEGEGRGHGLGQEVGEQEQGPGREEDDLVPKDVVQELQPEEDPGARKEIPDRFARGPSLSQSRLLGGDTEDLQCQHSCSTQRTDCSPETPVGPAVSGRG